MAKTHGQRLKILYILDFLKRESDEEHPVTAKDICEFLDSQGISAERKSVYRNRLHGSRACDHRAGR